MRFRFGIKNQFIKKHNNNELFIKLVYIWSTLDGPPKVLSLSNEMNCYVVLLIEVSGLTEVHFHCRKSTLNNNVTYADNDIKLSPALFKVP